MKSEMVSIIAFLENCLKKLQIQHQVAKIEIRKLNCLASDQLLYVTYVYSVDKTIMKNIEDERRQGMLPRNLIKEKEYIFYILENIIFLKTSAL